MTLIPGLVLIALAVLIPLAIIGGWLITSGSESFTLPTVPATGGESTDRLRLAYLRQQVQDSRDESDRLLQVVIGSIGFVLVAVTILVGFSSLVTYRQSQGDRETVRASADRLLKLEQETRVELTESKERLLQVELAAIDRLMLEKKWEQALNSLCGIMEDYDFAVVSGRFFQQIYESTDGALLALRRGRVALDRVRRRRLRDAMRQMPRTFQSSRAALEEQLDGVPSRLGEEPSGSRWYTDDNAPNVTH